IYRNFVPLSLDSLLELVDTLRLCFVTVEPSLQVVPQVFDWIEVRSLCRPLQDLNPVILEPPTCLGEGMFGIVVLLEDDLPPLKAVVVKSHKRLVVQDAAVKVGIHPSVYPTRVADPSGSHASPHHQGAATKL